MIFTYWCETKDGTELNFMSEEYHEIGTTIERNGLEFAIMDMIEESPISVTEILEILAEEREAWR
jgi:hypothetical protein